jgi:serine/threonine-protein kinase
VARPQHQQRPPTGYGQPQRPQPQRRPAPAPQRPAREPRQRSANPMHIPGLGCLKGCLFTICILVLAGWLIWDLTPLHTWVGEGQSYWHQLSTWAGSVARWFKHLGGRTGGRAAALGN